MSEPVEPSVAEMLGHARWVTALARRLARDPASADDLAQATWVVALEHAREPRSDLRGWLARVMRNLLRERTRRESARTGVERRAARDEELPSTEELVARADAERALVEAVLALDDPYKKTILLRYFEGLSPEEIARREGAPLATVASRLTRAHAKLRESLPAFAILLDRRLPRIFLMSTAAKILVPAAAILAGLAWFLRPDGSAPPVVNVPPRETVSLDAPAADPRSAVHPEKREPAAATPSAPAPVAVAAPLKADTGRIHGRVLRLDGVPAPRRKIKLLNPARSVQLEVEADDKGVFAAGDLAPGAWMLSTWPDSVELAALGKEDTSAAAAFAYLATRNVEVPAGADVEVLIGAPSANPIHVTGTVTVKGLRPGVDLMWIPPGEGALGRQKRAHADDSGRYEVELEDPRRYAVLIGGFSMQGLYDAVVDVPKAREARLDFAIPTSAVRGRVLDPDGSPVAGASVSLTLRGGRTQISLLMGRGRPATTNKAGSFEFDGLRPATYALVVSPPSKSALALTEPLEVALREGEVRDGIEITLRAGFAGGGTVVDAEGKPAEASVFVFDERGEPLNAIDPIRADGSGKFALSALAPGRYGVVALHDDAASAVADVEVGPSGIASPIALALSPGAIVRVEAAGTDATIHLRDARNRDFAPLLDPFALLLGIQRTWSADVHEFRVPAGNYVASAGAATARFGLVPRDERSVTLAR